MDLRICVKDQRHYVVESRSGLLLTVKRSRSEAKKFIRHQRDTPH